MTIPTRSYWQIAAGPTERSYANDFFRYAVGLIGPGNNGPWSAERADSDFEGPAVRWFATEVNLGDVFVLRSGNSQAIAVGLVASDYMHLRQFDDVNGWPLQHARRVRWFPLPVPHDFGRAAFGANPRRFSRIGGQQMIDYCERFLASPPLDWQTAPLPELPAEEPALEEVPQYLQGLVALANDLVAQCYWDSQRFGDAPSENEMVAHFVVPLLRSLGWRAEQIALEWRRTDVALFRTLPRTPENCQAIIEAKGLGAGVEGALAQAKAYVETQCGLTGSAGLEACGPAALGWEDRAIAPAGGRETQPGAAVPHSELAQPRAAVLHPDIVVTDGLRYRLYAPERNYEPVAYANLCLLKQSALKLFDRLRPSRGRLGYIRP